MLSRFIFSLLLCFIQFSLIRSNSIDWCEYWTRMGKKNERPECVGYKLPNNLKKSETVHCPKQELYNCLDCEPTCNNLVPKCRKEQCNRGCVCKTGLARNSDGKCIPYRECVNHYPSKNSTPVAEEEGTVMKTVKKMVPVIVNDVWRALFNSIRVPEETGNGKAIELKPVVMESANNLTFDLPQATKISSSGKGKVFINY